MGRRSLRFRRKLKRKNRMELEIVEGRPIVNLTLNGRRINFYKIGLGDIAKLDRHIQNKYEQDMLEKAGRIYGDVPDKFKDKAMDGLSREELEEAKETPEAMSFFIWRALLATYPNSKLEEVESLICLEDFNKVLEAVLPKEKKRGPVKKKAKK